MLSLERRITVTAERREERAKLTPGVTFSDLFTTYSRAIQDLFA
jgi:hypothetical protein